MIAKFQSKNRTKEVEKPVSADQNFPSTVTLIKALKNHKEDRLNLDFMSFIKNKNMGSKSYFW